MREAVKRKAELGKRTVHEAWHEQSSEHRGQRTRGREGGREVRMAACSRREERRAP